eukprot:jgi/Mesvir1/25560/Mv25008-RA.1
MASARSVVPSIFLLLAILSVAAGGWVPENLQDLNPKFGVECPPGEYVPAEELESRNRRLARWMQRAAEGGMQAMPEAKYNAELAKNRIWVYTDAMWPKPARCAALYEDAKAVILKSHCQISCHSYLIEHDYHFIMNLVWKAGSNSLTNFVLDNFRNASYVDRNEALVNVTVPRCIAQGGVPRVTSLGTDHTYIHVGMSREPMGRFISAFREAYTRDVFWPDLFSMMAACNCSRAAATVRLQKKYRGKTREILGLFARYISHAECGLYDDLFPLAGYHARPEATFLTTRMVADAEGDGEQMRVHRLIRGESFNEDLDALMDELGVNGTIRSSLGFQHMNLGERKDMFMPTSAVFEQFLYQHPQLLLQFCRTYVQDYVCFGYRFPEPCARLFVEEG